MKKKVKRVPHELISYLPHVNATLNSLATLLLIAGFVLIKRKKETAHKRVMLSCFAVSTLFLASYLVYHYNHPTTKFPSYPAAVFRYSYYAVLASHIVLAVFVPFLAIVTIYFGLKDRRQQHLKFAKWTFPIWLYVSVTGVIVYLMLYQIFPPGQPDSILK